MSLGFNYRHLYYFWVVAKEGGISRAAARLDMAVQTVSTQVRELERALGHALLKPAGRGLVLTEAGMAAMRQADQIFQLGEQLPELLREAVSTPGLRLAVGISDGLPKLVVRRLLQPVLPEPNLRLLCHEDEFDGLLADLALHRLDVVLADRAAPAHPNLKVYSHALGSSALSWYAPAPLLAQARRGFPQSLAKVPVLLPTASCRGAPSHRPVVRAPGTATARGGRIRGQRAAGHLRRGRHGRVRRPRPGARQAQRALRGQPHRRLRGRRGAFLRHRHRTQDPASAGAAPVAGEGLTAAVHRGTG